MSGEGGALIILIVSCSMLPRMIGFCRLHTHLSQLGVFDLADTERERERRLRLHLISIFFHEFTSWLLCLERGSPFLTCC